MNSNRALSYILQLFIICSLVHFVAYPSFGRSQCNDFYNSKIDIAISEAEVIAPKGELSFYESVGDMSSSDRYIKYPELLNSRLIDSKNYQKVFVMSYIVESNRLKRASENPNGYYRTFNNDRLLSWDLIQMADVFKGMKISQLLLGKILKRHPNVERVQALLDGDNAKAYRTNLALGSDKALQSTPAYKTLKKMGFTKIVFLREFDWPRGKGAEFVLSREDSDSVEVH